jgi:hypothetical protein
MNKQQRLELVNQVIAEISKRGHGFFGWEDRVARLEIDHRGRIWYINPESQKRIYTHNRDAWRNFNGGWTLQMLISSFRDFIRDGNPTIKDLYDLGGPARYDNWEEFAATGWKRFGWGYKPSELLVIWQIAKPMFCAGALEHFESVLSELQKVA